LSGLPLLSRGTAAIRSGGPAAEEVAVHPSRRRRDVRADVQRIAHVLADLEYPAEKWRVLAEADHYGADAQTRAQLWALPAGLYEDLNGVLARLGLPPDGAVVRSPARSAPRDVVRQRDAAARQYDIVRRHDVVRQREALRQRTVAAQAARRRPTH
jgi:hypothetical protein